MYKRVMMTTMMAFGLSAQSVMAQSTDLSSIYDNYPTESKIQETVDKQPEVLKKLFANNEKLLNYFDAGNGYTGWVLEYKPQGKRDFAIVYTSPDNKFAFTGYMLDDKGLNRSQLHRQQYIPAISDEGIWNAVTSSVSYTEGNPDATQDVYALFDPMCSYCHKLWVEFQDYKDQAKIHWIPVSIFGERSLGQTAAIIQADDPVAKIVEHGESFKPGRSDSGIKPLAPQDIKPETRQLLKQHSEMMGLIGATGTPTVIYKDQSGNVEIIGGVPQNEDLVRILGVSQ